MARRKAKAPAETSGASPRAPGADIDPEAQYSVMVKTMIVVGPTVIRPGPAILKGKHFRDRMSDVDNISPA